MVDPTALQQKVEDVGQPEDIKHACDAEQYHSISPVWVCWCGLLILGLGFLWLGQVGELPLLYCTAVLDHRSHSWPRALQLLGSVTRMALADLSGMLPADLEDVRIGETDSESSRGVEQRNNKGCESRTSPPFDCAPLHHIAVVTGFPPPEKRWQEYQSRVQPYENDAAAHSTRCHQGRISKRSCDGNVAVNANTRQRHHWNWFQNRHHVPEHLAGEFGIEAL